MPRFLAVLLLLSLPGVTPLRAQTARTAEQLLAEAEQLYTADQLFEAEKRYLRVLEVGAAGEVRQAYERLLPLYLQLSRPDSLIQLAGKYRAWLQRQRDPVRAAELDIDIGAAYFQLGHAEQARLSLEQALAASRARSFEPLKRYTALGVLARLQQQARAPQRAAQYWKQLEAEATQQLLNPGYELKPADRIQIVWKLAEAQREQRRPAEAAEQLLKLLPVHDGLRDLANKRETLRRLADLREDLGQHRLALRHLAEAQELHEKVDPRDRLTRGSLALHASRLHLRLGEKAESERWRESATADFQFVLKNPGSGQREVAGSVAAFWELEDLYQSRKQFEKALRVSEEQAAQWADGRLIQPRLQVQQGGLQTILGSYSAARDRLRSAVAALEAQTPLNLRELPRTYNNLALVELQLEDTRRAEGDARKALKLYGDFRLPDDLTRVESFNILGNALAQQGNYQQAILAFRDGVRICEQLGDAARVQRSNLLLNIALLRKSQGEIEDAIQICTEARAIYESTPSPDELTLAAYDASLAGMYSSRGRPGDLTRSAEVARQLLLLCERRKIDRGPLVVAARHALALESLAFARKFAQQGDGERAAQAYQQAERTWEQVRLAQEADRQSLLLPRTLNYLGLCRDLQGRDAEALAWYGKARALQQNNPRSFPQTSFITLWRSAILLHRQSRPAEAREAISEAIRVVERTRLQTYGEAQQRATFFAQFEGAFDLAIDWALEAGDLDSAFVAACRGRSRTLFDQLQMANVDPRRGLEASHAAELKRERELLVKLSGLRARAQLIPSDAIASDEAQRLLRDFDQAQADYAAVYREILNASPVYRSLSDEKVAQTSLRTIREQILDDETILLLYHLGRERSYVLLLTNRPETSSFHPLRVSAEIAGRIAPPNRVELVDGVLPQTRGLKLVRRNATSDELPERATPKEVAPVSQSVAKCLIDHYWEHVSDPGFRARRGMKVVVRPGAAELPPVRYDLIGDVFLPAEVRQRIAKLNAKRMIVIPDGPLHKLPLEAMLLEAGDKPVYLMDEMPPIVYAPSAAILTILTAPQRGEIAPDAPGTLLTISNPAYPEKKVDAESLGKVAPDERARQLFGALVRLEGTERESVHIRSYFEDRNVTALEGADATEGKFRAALKGQRFLHFAAHGFADDRFGNRFGALLLTPPDLKRGSPPPEDDGLLSLHEIYTLPLRQCELAVLSACVTNVGPQQPLEAGVTLASGFLCAGARNVVASNWSVDDDATVELMRAFFGEVVAGTAKNERVDYPRALQAARKKVREVPGYASPYYWAPFVIIGQVK